MNPAMQKVYTIATTIWVPAMGSPDEELHIIPATPWKKDFPPVFPSREAAERWRAQHHKGEETRVVELRVGEEDGTVETEPTTTEIVYTWPDGTEEVRYSRPYNGPEALDFIGQVETLRAAHGAACPYSYRHV